jgi:16S rRNA (cytidine1402-2'-O)-methyltransferase
MFEENKRGTLKELQEYYSAKGVKGEIVVVVQGNSNALKEKNEQVS